MPLQGFVDKQLPTIKAAWLNSVDVLLTTVFAVATTVAQARTALGLGTADSPTFGGVTAGAVTDSGLTATRVTYADTSGLLKDSANLTFDGTTLTAAGLAVALGSSADGDIYYRASGVLARLAKGTSLQVLQMNPGATAPAWTSPLILHVQDQKAQNTAGGNFATGAWRTRDLTTALVNNIAGASLATNAITLPAGTYWCDASAPGYAVNSHQARLYQTSGTPALILNGTTERSEGVTGTTTRSVVRGQFTLASQQTLELQHSCSNTNGAGFGLAANQGPEVYSDVLITRVA